MTHRTFSQARIGIAEARLCRQLPTGPEQWRAQITPEMAEQQANEQLPMTPERMRTYRELQTEAQRHQSIAISQFSIAQQALENVQRRTKNPNQAPFGYRTQREYWESVATNWANWRRQRAQAQPIMVVPPRPRGIIIVHPRPPKKVRRSLSWTERTEQRARHEFRERSPVYARRQLIQMINAEQGLSPVRPASEINARLHLLEAQAAGLPINERGVIDATEEGRGAKKVRMDQWRSEELQRVEQEIMDVRERGRMYREQWSQDIAVLKGRFDSIGLLCSSAPAKAPLFAQLVAVKDGFVSIWQQQHVIAESLPIAERMNMKANADQQLVTSMAQVLDQYERAVAA